MGKKIVFVTGTRADYDKMKPLMKALENNVLFEVYVFVCGMHLLEKFGGTYDEVIKDGYKNIYVAYGLSLSNNTSINLGNTICSLSGYVETIKPDMIIVHGDRIDALAGAIVGALNNILVAHMEGGEVSGTIDESIRHAISKFAHIHFVCTSEAQKRLLQLGEDSDHIFVVGSPDIDIMLSDSLPGFEGARERYELPFKDYGILMYHPVTTEYDIIGKHIESLVDAVLESEQNYIVIYPNNDLGSEIILNEYHRLENNIRIRLFPSIRFEYFLTLLKNSKFILGNSSAGIREAGIYGIPSIDVGSRQNGRYCVAQSKNIQHVPDDKEKILLALQAIDDFHYKSYEFGDGKSTGRLLDILSEKKVWDIAIQKRFNDL